MDLAAAVLKRVDGLRSLLATQRSSGISYEMFAEQAQQQTETLQAMISKLAFSDPGKAEQFTSAILEKITGMELLPPRNQDALILSVA